MTSVDRLKDCARRCYKLCVVTREENLQCDLWRVNPIFNVFVVGCLYLDLVPGEVFWITSSRAGWSILNP